MTSWHIRFLTVLQEVLSGGGTNILRSIKTRKYRLDSPLPKYLTIHAAIFLCIKFWQFRINLDPISYHTVTNSNQYKERIADKQMLMNWVSKLPWWDQNKKICYSMSA